MLRKIRFVLLRFTVTFCLLALATTGCLVTPPASPKAPGGTPEREGDVRVIEQAWDFIHNDYVDKDKINDAKMTGAAIKAMLDTLNDPYTFYFDVEAYRLHLTSLEGRFEGIGATVTMTEDKKVKVIATVKDSPAEKAGIRPGDIILGIDGRSTEGMSLTEAVLYIRGPQGTKVELSIQHEGELVPVTIAIVRAQIEMPSVEFEMRDDIAYIMISQFSERTDAELTPLITQLSEKKASGIVLDLRGNPGGLLNSVIEVASHFLRSGVVVSVVDNRGRQTSSSVRRTSVTDLPIVVLVDKYSASSSEVLAGALQDHERAVIAGTRTFGKGSVNVLRQLRDGAGGVYITTGRWLTPKGSVIEGKGVTPDYELELEGDDAVKWAIDYLKSSEKSGVPELLRI